MTLKTLQAIKDRLEKRTQGTWQPCKSDSPKWVFATRPHVDIDGVEIVTVSDSEWKENRNNDAEFVANAPADIAALIAEVERLQLKLNRSVEQYFIDELEKGGTEFVAAYRQIEVEELEKQVKRLQERVKLAEECVEDWDDFLRSDNDDETSVFSNSVDKLERTWKVSQWKKFKGGE